MCADERYTLASPRKMAAIQTMGDDVMSPWAETCSCRTIVGREKHRGSLNLIGGPSRPARGYCRHRDWVKGVPRNNHSNEIGLPSVQAAIQLPIYSGCQSVSRVSLPCVTVTGVARYDDRLSCLFFIYPSAVIHDVSQLSINTINAVGNGSVCSNSVDHPTGK